MHCNFYSFFLFFFYILSFNILFSRNLDLVIFFYFHFIFLSLYKKNMLALS